MSKKTWQTPTFTVHGGDAMNKFGRMPDRNVIDNLEGVAVDSLLAEYGSPLFVISERQLRENARRLRRAFETRYPKVVHGWSYKTNYLGAVCNILHQEGSLAEVVSGFEYEKARALGVPGDKILFNGPCKKRPILERVVREGGQLHIDNFDELHLLEDVAAEAGRTVSVTIRMNFNTGYSEPWSRFGFNLESGQALEAARYIGKCPHLELTGLHSHIGTFVLDPRAYASQVKIMCDFMVLAEQETGCRIDALDIGGGFASRNALHGIYLPPEQVVPSIDQYAEAVCNTLLECTRDRPAQGLPQPTLVLESGRWVVDDAEVLITSVVGTKRLPDGRRSAVLDAGVNLLFTGFWYNHHVQPTRVINGVPEDTVLYGPLCMNIDVVRQSAMLPPLTVGDSLVISPVGAYNNTQWMQFIEYRPAVVMIQENGDVALLREAEDLHAVTALEHLPAHLRVPFAEPEPAADTA